MRERRGSGRRPRRRGRALRRVFARQQGSQKAGSKPAQADDSKPSARAIGSISVIFPQILSKLSKFSEIYCKIHDVPEILRNFPQFRQNSVEFEAKNAWFAEKSTIFCKILEKSTKKCKITQKFWNEAVQRCDTLVDFEKCWKMRLLSLSEVSIQPRTNRLSSRWLEPAREPLRLFESPGSRTDGRSRADGRTSVLY